MSSLKVAPFETTTSEHLADWYSAAISRNRRDWERQDFNTLAEAESFINAAPPEMRFRRIYRRYKYETIVAIKIRDDKI